MDQDKKLTLLNDFPAVSTEQWESVIHADLKGADYDKKLLWKTDEKITVRPYYRADALRSIDAQLNPVPGEFPYVRGAKAANEWTIAQGVDATDLAKANADAVDAVKRGAEAVSFRIQHAGDKACGPLPKTTADLAKLTAGVKAPVYFLAGDLAGSILKLIFEAGAATKGLVDFDPLNDLLKNGSSASDAKAIFAEVVEVVKTAAAKTPELKPIAIRASLVKESGGTIVEELAAALSAGVEYLTALTEAGVSVDVAAKAIWFDLAIGSNYFFEIAKLRALRLLWAQVVEQFKPADKSSAKAFIYSATALYDTTAYDQHVNLLRGTTKSAAAILGGSDVVETLPFDANLKESDETSQRLSRNTQIILKKESYFDRVVDPGAGSYYLETITEQLAAEAWKLFQEIEAKGGYLKAIEAGFVQETVAASRAAKAKAISSRRTTVLGTNQYPNVKETVLDGFVARATVAAPAAGGAAITVKALTPSRGAEGYEAMRMRTERAVKAGKKNPRFLLLEYGDVKMRKARVGFSLNFIGTAGFDVFSKISDATPEAAAKVVAEAAADVVVLCSSDEEYAPMAKPLIAALGGKVPVIVAGAPADSEQLKADGVVDFINIRSNALDLLSTWQTKLGITE